MSNLIGWGIVYCSSWFGQTDETTISIQNESAPLCFTPANEIVDQYNTYVTNNGGVYENTTCLTAFLQDIGEDDYYEIFDTYFLRMTDDGATIEGLACATQQLFILN